MGIEEKEKRFIYSTRWRSARPFGEHRMWNFKHPFNRFVFNLGLSG